MNRGHYPNLGKKPPRGDSPGRHPSSHHSDSSGAHVRGTHHHLSNAHTTADGQGREAEDHELAMGQEMPQPGRDLQRTSHGDVDRSSATPGGAMADTRGPEDDTSFGTPE